MSQSRFGPSADGRDPYCSQRSINTHSRRNAKACPDVSSRFFGSVLLLSLVKMKKICITECRRLKLSMKIPVSPGHQSNFNPDIHRGRRHAGHYITSLILIEIRNL